MNLRPIDYNGHVLELAEANAEQTDTNLLNLALLVLVAAALARLERRPA